MALTLALATIQMATLHASHPTLHVLSPLRGAGGHTLSVYYNDKSLIIIVQNTLF
jgi:hypothetical protein